MPKINYGVNVKRVVGAGEVAVVFAQGKAEAKGSTEGVVPHVKASVLWVYPL